MKQSDYDQFASEAKLALAYSLLDYAFAEMSAAYALADQNAAWGMLATINGHIARSIREEGAKLVTRGYALGELKEISDRLNESILAAGRAIDTQRGLPEFAALVREALGESKKVA
jgi:hypothetical protein